MATRWMTGKCLAPGVAAIAVAPTVSTRNSLLGVFARIVAGVPTTTHCARRVARGRPVRRSITVSIVGRVPLSRSCIMVNSVVVPRSSRRCHRRRHQQSRDAHHRQHDFQIRFHIPPHIWSRRPSEPTKVNPVLRKAPSYHDVVCANNLFTPI